MSAVYGVDRSRWSKLTILEQMGNIGSEVGRALKAKRDGDDRGAFFATIRALDLFNATAECLAGKRSPRLVEVLRSKDRFLRLIDDNFIAAEADGLEKYFTQFAVAARANRK